MKFNHIRTQHFIYKVEASGIIWEHLRELATVDFLRRPRNTQMYSNKRCAQNLSKVCVIFIIALSSRL